MGDSFVKLSEKLKYASFKTGEVGVFTQPGLKVGDRKISVRFIL